MMFAMTIEHAVTKPTRRRPGDRSTGICSATPFIGILTFAKSARTANCLVSAVGGLLSSRLAVRSFNRACYFRIVRSHCRDEFGIGMNAHPRLSVDTATQLAVFLANRPGALARVC